MEEQNEKSVNHVYESEVISFDIALKDKYELDLQGKFEVKLYDGKYFVERIKPQYPKTYKECCKIMKIHPSYKLFGQAITQGEITNCVYVQNLLKNINIFQKLITCRDVYWKIAGDWKPDWEKSEQPKFGLYTLKNEIRLINLSVPKNLILVFPTEEIRDIFYKNFKELIELCKEFL